MNHLELLNVVLTWRFRQPGWPPVLADSGYQLDGVSVGLLLADGHRKIVPEVIATRQFPGVTAFIEVKGGRNAEEDQLERMLSITPVDLRDINHLSISDPQNHQIQILYVCNWDEVGRLARQVQHDRVAVVGFNGTKYTTHGRFLDPRLEAAFNYATVGARSPCIPLIPFEHDSPTSVIARCVLPEIIAALVQGLGMLNADGLLQKTHGLLLQVMRPTGAGGELVPLRRRVVEVVNDAMRNELAAWLDRPTADPVWRFRRPLASDPAAKTRDLQLLQRAADQMLARLSDARGLQLSFLDDSS